MKVKSNEISIFNGIEQGSGSNSKNVYMYFKPNMITEVNEWIRKTYGINFTVKNKTTYEISVRTVDKEEKMYSTQVNDFIVDRIKEI